VGRACAWSTSSDTETTIPVPGDAPCADTEMRQQLLIDL
jgi:hypothetical protein